MNGEKFNSDRAPRAVGLYPHARKVGNLLFLSGVGPRKAGHTDIPGVTLNENGEIENRIIEDSGKYTGSQLLQTSNYLSDIY